MTGSRVDTERGAPEPANERSRSVSEPLIYVIAAVDRLRRKAGKGRAVSGRLLLRSRPLRLRVAAATDAGTGQLRGDRAGAERIAQVEQHRRLPQAVLGLSARSYR